MNYLFKSIHQSWLLVGLCLGIILGTIIALAFRVEFFSSIYWVVFVAILFVFAFFKPNYMFCIIIFLAGILLAFFRISEDLSGQDFIKQLIGANVIIEGKVIDDPDINSDGKTNIRLSASSINEQMTKGMIFVQLSDKKEDIMRSDIVLLEGQLSEGFGNFSGYMYKPEIKNISHPEPGDLFLQIRNKFAGQIKKFIPKKESSLGLAYLLGMKSELDDEILTMLQIVGLTHIVVASGTHLGIIVSLVKKIFGKLSRFAGFLFSILFILFFGGIIGWTASITRATIVTILSLSAWYVGRKFEAWRILLISAAITLLINPLFVINLGWLLSFGSFAGILILMPIIKNFFFGEKKIRKITEIILATISAQLLCIPISFYFFGSMSIISILANLLILPTIPFAMCIVFLTGIFSFIDFLGTIFGTVAVWTLDYHLAIVNFLSEQKSFLIEIEKDNPLIFLLYVPILMPFVIYYFRQRKLRAKLNKL